MTSRNESVVTAPLCRIAEEDDALIQEELMSSKITDAVGAVASPAEHETSRLAATVGALFVYMPFGTVLSLQYPGWAVIGAVVTVGIATVPDRVGPARWSHSITGASALGTGFGCVGWWVADTVTIVAGGAIVTPATGALYCFTLGFLATHGHILADAVTDNDVQPLWPLSNRGGSINLPRFVDPRCNETTSAIIGTVVTSAVVASILTQVLF